MREMHSYGIANGLSITIGREAAYARGGRGAQGIRGAGAHRLMFEKLALIGIGLIGSSIACAARQKGLAKTIAISTRKAETLDEARALGLGDIYTLDPAEAVKHADLVILCIPVLAYASGDGEDRPLARAGRDPVRCRLGQAAASSRRWRRMCPRACI